MIYKQEKRTVVRNRSQDTSNFGIISKGFEKSFKNMSKDLSENLGIINEEMEKSLKRN